MFEKIGTLYEFFYRRIYKQPYYIFQPSEASEKHINSFINLLDKRYKIETIGDNFITKYFIFQFDYWVNLDLTSYNKTINLPYIIGKKAFDRWVKRNRDFDYTIDKVDINKKLTIRQSDLLSIITKEGVIKEGISRGEEIEKNRFQGTKRQLLHCIENTTLYNSKSKVCITCSEKRDCKKILEKRFPQVFHHRFINN